MSRASQLSSSGDRIVLIQHLIWLVCVSDCLVCRSRPASSWLLPRICNEMHGQQNIKFYCQLSLLKPFSTSWKVTLCRLPWKIAAWRVVFATSVPHLPSQRGQILSSRTHDNYGSKLHSLLYVWQIYRFVICLCLHKYPLCQSNALQCYSELLIGTKWMLRAKWSALVTGRLWSSSLSSSSLQSSSRTPERFSSWRSPWIVYACFALYSSVKLSCYGICLL